MTKTGGAAILAMALVLAAGGAGAGPVWNIDSNCNMTLSFLGQVHCSYVDTDVVGADREDAFLRRGRFILSGQIQDGVKFFVETDNDNAGKNGEAPVSTDLQDMFVDVRLGPSDHWLKAGLILLPFSFESRASAASLLGNDYNSEAIKLVNTFTWRDIGAEVHGNVGKQFSYAAGVFDGMGTSPTPKFKKNDDALPRVTGHVACNLLGEAETGWFYTQNRLGKGPYLSLGLGVDGQKEATETISTNAADVRVQDSGAWVADIQSGFVLGEGLSLVANGAYYEWDNAQFAGRTGFLESGLMLNQTMLTMKYSQSRPFAGGPGFAEDYTAGLHYFLKGHNARAGLEYRWGTSDDLALLGLQFLL